MIRRFSVLLLFWMAVVSAATFDNSTDYFMSNITISNSTEIVPEIVNDTSPAEDIILHTEADNSSDYLSAMPQTTLNTTSLSDVEFNSTLQSKASFDEHNRTTQPHTQLVLSTSMMHPSPTTQSSELVEFYSKKHDVGETNEADLLFESELSTAAIATVPENGSLEESLNAIPTVDAEATDKIINIIVGHKCSRVFQDSILWNDTDGGMLALKACPAGYQGSMFRPCFSSGKWGNVDFSECRLEHLGRMRHMILHQVQKGMLGTMYKLVDEFSKYISSVDMKSPMDRLEAFEILNTFLKLDMNLKMDKTKDIKYIQTLLHTCSDLLRKKTILFSPGSQKNKLIKEKAVEMMFDLSNFAERALRGLLKTQKKHISFRSSPNIVMYLHRGKLSGHLTLMNYSPEYEKEVSSLNLESTLERSAYALIFTKGLGEILSGQRLLLNSDVATAAILSPLDSLNHMPRSPTYDVGLRLLKPVPGRYQLKCGQIWNMSLLWNTKECYITSSKGDSVVCRCHHLGSIALLLEEKFRVSNTAPSPPVGKIVMASCISQISAILVTLVSIFVFKRGEQHLTIFILINLLICMLAIQLLFLYGINYTSRFEFCLGFALLLHYLFLVLCFWLVAYGLNILLRLRSKPQYSGKIRDYCAFCWVLPSFLLIISFVGNPQGYETKHYCWLNVQHGLLWSFVFPTTGLIVFNTVAMIMSLKTFNQQMPVTHRTEISRTTRSIQAGITLLPFFAINWFFGLLAVDNSSSILLQLVFGFTNFFEGCMAMIFFVAFDQNIQMALRHKFSEVSKKPKVSAMRMRKSGSFPVLERNFADDRRRLDCTPLLAGRAPYHDIHDDPCCSNIRV